MQPAVCAAEMQSKRPHGHSENHRAWKLPEPLALFLPKNPLGTQISSTVRNLGIPLLSLSPFFVARDEAHLGKVWLCLISVLRQSVRQY